LLLKRLNGPRNLLTPMWRRNLVAPFWIRYPTALDIAVHYTDKLHRFFDT